MSKQDLDGYSEEIKQAFSLQNATENEINNAKYHRVQAM
jgi:hypothetical protein